MSSLDKRVKGYTIKLKHIFGQDIFVLSYSNDLMSYISSFIILKERGYEDIRSHLSTGMPGTYKSNIEAALLREMVRLALQVGVPQPE